MKSAFLAVLLLVTLSLQGQYSNKQLDSFYHVYLQTKTDTGKLRLLNHFSHRMLQKDRVLAVNLARTALQLSEKSEDKEQKATAIYNYGYLLRYAEKGDSSLHYLYKAKILFSELKDTSALAYIYTQLAANMNDQGNNNATISYMDSAVIYFSKVENWINASRSLGILGNMYSMKNDYQSGLRTGLRSLKIAKKIDDSATIGRALSTLSGTYKELEDYGTSRYFAFMAIDINNRHGDAITQYLDYKNLAGLYNEQFMYDSGLWALNKALTLLDTNARPAYYAAILTSMAHNSIKLRKFKEGKDILDEAYGIAASKGYTTLLPNIEQYYGLYYFDQKNFTQAKEHYLKGLQFVKDQGKFQSLKYYYIALGNIAEEQGNYKEALEYEKLLVAYNDSTFKLDRSIALSNAESQFGLEKRDLRINILNQEAEIKERKSAKQRMLIIGSFTLAILAGMLGFLGVRQNKLNQKLKMERFRNRVAADLHDDVGSTLSSISMYSEVLKQKAKDRIPEALPMLENMSSGSKEIMDAMSDIVWTINPKNNTIQNLLNRLKVFSSQLCEAKDIKFVYEGDQTEGIRLGMETSQNIYLVLKEAINNALKYSDCTELKLSTTTEPKKFLFMVSDNGIGFNMTTHDSGNGLRTMKERMKEVKGVLDIESGINGTTVSGTVIL